MPEQLGLGIPVSNHDSLSEAVSNLVSRIPQLLCRLRELESEETKLDAQATQLAAQLATPRTKDRSSQSTVPTPASKLRIRSPKSRVERGTPRTPHMDPRNFETPVKAFLLMESFASTISVKSKRKGRIFFRGDSTELGEKR